MSRPTILFDWYHRRADLTGHLWPLREAADLVFIDGHSREDGQPSGDRLVYWGDYASPYALLDAVRPSLVVFADIEAFQQLALNIAARNRGIPTCVLQHGLQYPVSAVEALPQPKPLSASRTTMWTLRFLLSALRPRNAGSLPGLARFIYERKRYPLGLALQRNRFELRRADRYIEFSPANAQFHASRDGVSADRFILTGNPGYDDFFARIEGFKPKGEYGLLLDTPFLEASLGSYGRMPTAEKDRYLHKLNRLCAGRGLKLLVKLHPLSFKAELPQDPNITYVREGDLAQLAGEAEFVMLVHFASLTPPMILKKPFFYFDNPYIPPPATVRALGIESHDLLAFEPEQLGEPSPPVEWSRIGDYIQYADGGSGARVRSALLELAGA